MTWNKMHVFRTLQIFLLVFLLAQPSFASRKKNRHKNRHQNGVSQTVAAPVKSGDQDQVVTPIEKLLRGPTRPTLEEFEKTWVENYGDKWEWLTKNGFRTGRLSHVSKTQIADVIVAMERAFPGATYYPLGRDAFLLGDVLDGFYRSIGQKDRIKRLDASGPSFPHYRSASDRTLEEDREILTGFLQTNGLDLEHVDTAPPFVMFDVTSWNSTSQSYQLVRSAYATYAKMGGDLQKLYEKFNFAGVGMGGWGSHEVISPNLNVEEYKEGQKREVSERGIRVPLFLPRAASDLCYSEAWHPMFGPFRRTDEGKVVTSIPDSGGSWMGEGSRSERVVILSQLFEIRKMMNDPEFLKLVQSRARVYGYEFPLARITKLKMIERTPEELQEAKSSGYMSGYKGYGSSDDDSDDLSEHIVESKGGPYVPSFKMDQWQDEVEDTSMLAGFKHNLRTSLETTDDQVRTALFFLNDLAGMWDPQTMTVHDLKDVYKIVMPVKKNNRQRFMPGLSEILLKHPLFRGVFFESSGEDAYGIWFALKNLYFQKRVTEAELFDVVESIGEIPALSVTYDAILMNSRENGFKIQEELRARKIKRIGKALPVEMAKFVLAQTFSDWSYTAGQPFRSKWDLFVDIFPYRSKKGLGLGKWMSEHEELRELIINEFKRGIQRTHEENRVNRPLLEALAKFKNLDAPGGSRDLFEARYELTQAAIKHPLRQPLMKRVDKKMKRLGKKMQSVCDDLMEKFDDIMY